MLAPLAGEHPDPDVPVVEVLHQVDEMAEIATEAIEPPDDDHVSLPRRLEEGGEPRAVLTLSRRLVLVDRLGADAGLAQSIPLQVEALGTVRLRDPRVADQHWRLQNEPDRVKSRDEAAGPVSSAKWKHDDVMPAATQDLGSVSLVRRGDPSGLW